MGLTVWSPPASHAPLSLYPLPPPLLPHVAPDSNIPTRAGGIEKSRSKYHSLPGSDKLSGILLSFTSAAKFYSYFIQVNFSLRYKFWTHGKDLQCSFPYMSKLKCLTLREAPPIPDICHFFSTYAIFGSIFLHTKVRKSRQNRFRDIQRRSRQIPFFSKTA